MRVLISSYGATGDVYPMLALAKEFIEQGHYVRFACFQLFHKEVIRSGAEWVEIPPRWSQDEFASFIRQLSARKSPTQQLRFIYEKAAEHYPELLKILENQHHECDLHITSHLFPQFRYLADKYKIPFFTVSFCHNVVPSDDYPPDVVPKLRWLPRTLRQIWNHLWWELSTHATNATLHNSLLKNYHPEEKPYFKDLRFKPADKSIIAVSPGLFYPQDAQIDKHFIFTGYLRFQVDEDPEIEAQCEAFCEGEKVPIITFGSLAFHLDSHLLESFLKRWPDDKKIIIQSGWANFQPNASRSNVLYVSKTSHDSLFKRASVVFHHGGAGTTASALYAGCPQLIMPHIGDQMFWAKQMIHLGVGLRVMPSFWPKQAPRLIKRLETQVKYKTNANKYAIQLRAENGSKCAVEVLMTHLEPSSK